MDLPQQRDFTVTVDDGALACTRSGGGPAIVFLHGWTLDRRMWAAQLAALSRDFLAITLDRRGFGRSSAQPDLAREVADVASVLDATGAQRAVIVGMSQAGRVALDFALKRPSRVSGLVLQGAPLAGVTPGPVEDEAIPIVEYAALVRAGHLSEMKRRWRAHPLMRTFNSEAEARAEAILEDYEGRDLAAASTMAELEAHDISRVSAPALVITGAQDTPWRRRAGDALARHLPQAERREIAGAGHLCNLCAPTAYNDALRAFLRASG